MKQVKDSTSMVHMIQAMSECVKDGMAGYRNSGEEKATKKQGVPMLAWGEFSPPVIETPK
jgi:hypothetical protein